MNYLNICCYHCCDADNDNMNFDSAFVQFNALEERSLTFITTDFWTCKTFLKVEDDDDVLNISIFSCVDDLMYRQWK